MIGKIYTNNNNQLDQWNQVEDELKHGVQQTDISFEQNSHEDENNALLENKSHKLMEIRKDIKNNQPMKIKS